MVAEGSALGLTVSGVTVRYGPITAVDNASLEVRKGEIVALTGPSGCGKSSLLRAVAGLEPLASGAVTWGGEDVAALPTHMRGFGMIFQDGQLFGHMSVAKNIAYGLAKLPRAAREQRVASMLQLIGMPEYGSRAVTELSGGQRQRVALARSLAPEPQLLLLDEPLSSLDHALRGRLAQEIAELLRKANMTAILVTHDQGEAETIADRVLQMADGRIVEA